MANSLGVDIKPGQEVVVMHPGDEKEKTFVCECGGGMLCVARGVCIEGHFKGADHTTFIDGRNIKRINA